MVAAVVMAFVDAEATTVPEMETAQKLLDCLKGEAL